MKGDFIIKFIEAIIKTGKDINTISNWTPLYYKGIKIRGYDYKKTHQGFRNLKSRGIIAEDKNRGFRLTAGGRVWFRDILSRNFKYFRQKWDKKWRIVIFDIPQELHKERTNFRRKLKSLGFYMLQKSVFIFPYPCEEEVGRLASHFKISDQVDFITAESAGYSEDDIKRFFN